jgi:hypothetical protein
LRFRNDPERESLAGLGDNSTLKLEARFFFGFDETVVVLAEES